MSSESTQRARELLLARHQSANLQLDEIRETAIAAMSQRARRTSNSDLRGVVRALFYPDRFVWTSLVAVWLALAALHWSQRRKPANSNEIPPAVIANWFVAQNHEIFVQVDPTH